MGQKLVSHMMTKRLCSWRQISLRLILSSDQFREAIYPRMVDLQRRGSLIRVVKLFRGRGRRDAHRESENASSVPMIGMDYWFMGECREGNQGHDQENQVKGLVPVWFVLCEVELVTRALAECLFESCGAEAP